MIVQLFTPIVRKKIPPKKKVDTTPKREENEGTNIHPFLTIVGSQKHTTAVEVVSRSDKSLVHSAQEQGGMLEWSFVGYENVNFNTVDHLLAQTTLSQNKLFAVKPGDFEKRVLKAPALVSKGGGAVEEVVESASLKDISRQIGSMMMKIIFKNASDYNSVVLPEALKGRSFIFRFNFISVKNDAQDNSRYIFDLGEKVVNSARYRLIHMVIPNDYDMDEAFGVLDGIGRSPETDSFLDSTSSHFILMVNMSDSTYINELSSGNIKDVTAKILEHLAKAYTFDSFGLRKELADHDAMINLFGDLKNTAVSRDRIDQLVEAAHSSSGARDPFFIFHPDLEKMLLRSNGIISNRSGRIDASKAAFLGILSIALANKIAKKGDVKIKRLGEYSGTDTVEHTPKVRELPNVNSSTSEHREALKLRIV